MKDNNISKTPKSKKEPLILMTKRDVLPISRRILIRLAAILIALVINAVITILITKQNPILIYKSMILGAFGTVDRLWVVLHRVSILLCISIAVTPAFRMRFWNIGAEGQTLISALGTAAVMFYLGGKIPDVMLIVIMLIAAVIAGIIWGVIPAFFKAIWSTNETLFTLMMNYVAIQLVEYFLKIADKSGSNTVGPDLLSHGWLPTIGQQYLLTIIIVALLTVAMYIYLNYSKHGYEISVSGESENTARYVGINVKKITIRTMALSGALCGIAGFLLVAGASHSISSNLVEGRGFTAIMVSWLAKFNPATMVLTSSLLVILERGAGEVSTMFGLNSSFSDILTGIILFFIIGCEFFINYKIKFNFGRNNKAEEAAK